MTKPNVVIFQAGGLASAAVPLLQVGQLSKSFGAVKAVDDVSLVIDHGAFFCLLGPSGCGKTSLMRMIAGFEKPDAGCILLDGRDIADMPAHLRPINMMFQSYALFPHLSVFDNIAFGLKQGAHSGSEIRSCVDEMLELVQLKGMEARKPAQLSGGQKQRVALARALARKPRLLLLDEPLAALDKKLRLETQGQLKHIQHQLGTSFLVVTHDPDEAMGLADQIAVMESGRIVQTGTPADIYERPLSLGVAALVGNAGSFDCDVLNSENGLADIHIRALQMQVQHVPMNADVLHRPSCLLVRPEHVRLVFSRPADSAVECSVTQVTYQGDSYLVRVALAGGSPSVLARVSKLDAMPQMGQPAWFLLNGSDCRVVAR